MRLKTLVYLFFTIIFPFMQKNPLKWLKAGPDPDLKSDRCIYYKFCFDEYAERRHFPAF